MIWEERQLHQKILKDAVIHFEIASYMKHWLRNKLSQTELLDGMIESGYVREIGAREVDVKGTSDN